MALKQLLVWHNKLFDLL